MAEPMSLALEKIEQDTKTMARAVAIANSDRLLAPEDRRPDLLTAIWAAEDLLSELEKLNHRSETSWREADDERRLAERRERLSVRDEAHDG